MSTSERTFDHVKSILGKLDRNREAARDRRVAGGVRPVSPPPVPTTLATPDNNGARPQPGGGYGRATPLRLTERHDQ